MKKLEKEWVNNNFKVSEKEADDYFNSRPYESKISAWASDQSNSMKEGSELLKKVDLFSNNSIFMLNINDYLKFCFNQ